MSRIDNYVASMERFGATALILGSDSNVTLRFPAGDRHATQTTSHAQLEALIRETAPPSSLSAIERGAMSKFRYQGQNQAYDVTVTPREGKWTITVEPAREEAASASIDGLGLDTGGGMEIERTQYASVSAPVSAPPAAPPAPPGGSAIAAAHSIDPAATDWIDQILRMMKQADASDVHLSSGSPPYWRLHGNIEPIPGQPVLDADFLGKQLMAMSPERNRIQFEEIKDTDFAYAIPGLSRFRVNVFEDRKGPGAVMRTIPFEIPSAEKLGLSPAILDMANLTKGLVLVTGPTGSGKSTTLAALIDHINRTRQAHLITIEDPIEFVHENKKCLVNQREISKHTMSFKNALRAALREDPDIVLVGEMRDLETIEIAVETAETGHLVFGTLHTTTAPSTVDRIIDQFPTDRQEQIRQMLAKSLKGVVAQVLCRKIGGGRVAAQEILIGTSAVENLIRERKTFQLFSLMQTGKNLGMQKMEDALLELVKAEKVEALEAYRHAVNKVEFQNSLQRAGIPLE